MKTVGVQHTPEELVELYGDMVYKIALSQTKNRADADDVFQETFLGMMKTGRSFENPEHEKSYLIRTALNACKKLHASAWSRHRADFEEAELMPDTSGMTDEEREVYSAVLALPEKYRTVIHLFYYEELSIAQMAKALGKHEGTIKSQLSRGRKILEKSLREGE